MELKLLKRSNDIILIFSQPRPQISFDIFFPNNIISPKKSMPNRLKVCLKSYDGKKWVEYTPNQQWYRVKKEGNLHIDNILDKFIKDYCGLQWKAKVNI